MKLTTKSRYGTRLMLDLAINAQAGPVSLNDVAKRQNISMKYLEHLIRSLKIAELITSRRGPYGGHMLAKPPEEISVGDIVRALEGQVVITNCAEEEEKLCGMCNRAGQCLSQSVWIGAGKVLFDYLDQITIGSLVERKKAAEDQSSRILS